MALTYHPKRGTVLMCDFVGFKTPEMVKKRPVVVVSGRLRRSQLVTVIPLSTTPPDPVEDHHHQMDPASLPGQFATKQTWAKCDMVVTVGFWRLNKVMVRDANGNRVYLGHRVTDADFKAILKGMLCAFDLKGLTSHIG
ncbi:MAG: type II toxin-antitoxin system PemK/MazF family toxin [Thermodesulfobacteriota bacterium]